MSKNIFCCPACGSTNMVPLFDMGEQPMSLVELQGDPDKSATLPRHPIRLVICQHCTHVHNFQFHEGEVSYDAAGCRMFNAGLGWQKHLDEVRTLLMPLDASIESIVEIGAGGCEFLASLEMDAEKFAVDPCEAVEIAEEHGIAYDRKAFDPELHLPSDDEQTLIIMRHLLEHMGSPRDLLEILSTALASRVAPSWIYIEVPCCENALKYRRVDDWTYEHPQHFTVESMKALLHACNLDHFMILPKYGGEVLSILVQVEVREPRDEHLNVDLLTDDYVRMANNLERERSWIKAHLHCTTFWGGAGKSAMFLHLMDVPADAVVVDSHEAKWGLCVPGTRIKIMPLSVMARRPADYIIVTAAWRANDIAKEIVRDGIPCKTLLKFEGGELTEVSLGR